MTRGIFPLKFMELPERPRPKHWRLRRKLLLFGVPIVLLFLFLTFDQTSHSPVFTALPPAPQVIPYVPEQTRPSVIPALKLEANEKNNPAVAALVLKITELETKLIQLETKVYANDPALLAYESYRSVVDKWYQERPQQRAAWTKYAYPADPVEAKRRQQVCSSIQTLLPAILMKEQLKEPDFSPLIVNSLIPFFKNMNSEQIFFDSDRVARYRSPMEIFLRLAQKVRQYFFPNCKRVPMTYKQWLSRVNRRYPVYVAALERIKSKESISEEVLNDIKDYTAQNILSGLTVEIYVPFHIPQDLVTARRELDNQIVKLRDVRRARATSGSIE